MKILKNNFCQFFTSETNNPYYSIEFENYCIGNYTFRDLDINKNFDIPTIIIGWDFVKNNFKNIKISQKKIKHNLYWTFSEEEESEINQKDIKKFISKSLYEYLPQNYITFDCVLNGNIFDNLDKIFSDQLNFCFVSKSVLYVFNKNNFIGINLDSIDYIYENRIEFFNKIIENYNLVFFNYYNIPDYIKNKESKLFTLENICWICNNFVLNETSLYKFSPYPLNEKYYVFLMSKLYELLNCSLLENKDLLIRFNKKDFITEWLSSRRIYFSNGKKVILKYSNKRTITGRINCVDKKFNPQLLPKNSEIRSEIISEFNKGKIVVFDYVSFETKLSVYLTKDEDFINTFKDKDLHVETAKAIYKKSDISHEERKVAKLINHALIYGVGNERLKSILLDNNLPVKSIDEVKKLFKPILENSKKISEKFKKNNYIINPYNTIIYPNKEWAVYNNYIQSVAADMVVDKLIKIKNFLEDKKSQFMYQVFDSFIFDIHPNENEIIEEIKNILQSGGKYIFEVEYKIGNSLMECTEQNTEEEIDAIN